MSQTSTFAQNPTTQTSTFTQTQSDILSYLNTINDYPMEIIKDELAKFETFIISDPNSKPAYLSAELSIIKTYGNGLCWINSLLTSIFGYYWQSLDELDLWIQSLISTLNMDTNFVPILGLEEYMNNTSKCKTKYKTDLKITSSGSDTFMVVDFINSNKLLIHILSLNILKFAVLNYYNPMFNIVDKLLPLETGIAFNAKKNKFYAIDGQMRNFIMSIMGIQKVVVFQNKIDHNNRRHSNMDYRLAAIDYYGEYAGFEIRAFDIINIGLFKLNVLLYTHNSEHYDAFFDSITFKTTVANTSYGEDLPTFIEFD